MTEKANVNPKHKHNMKHNDNRNYNETIMETSNSRGSFAPWLGRRRYGERWW
jgi:hypothetical protein